MTKAKTETVASNKRDVADIGGIPVYCRYDEAVDIEKVTGHPRNPTKPGVCRFRVVMPALPNAYKPDMQPRPIRPEECKGCPYFTDRALAFHQPHKQEVIHLEYPVGSE